MAHDNLNTLMSAFKSSVNECVFAVMYFNTCFVQVICWRAAASVAWAVLLLPPITAAFVILSRFSLLHPIQTISGQSPRSLLRFDSVVIWGCVTLTVDFFSHAECLSLLTSASAVFSLILLCGVILVVGFLNLEYYTGESQDTGVV